MPASLSDQTDLPRGPPRGRCRPLSLPSSAPPARSAWKWPAAWSSAISRSLNCGCWPRPARWARRQKFRGQELAIQELTEASFEGVDIALFSAGGSISKRFAPIAARAGAIVIDNSSAFRMHADVPLVIPEINADQIGAPPGHHRQSELRGHHLDSAAVAHSSEKPHPAAAACDLPGRLGRRGRRHGGAARGDPRASGGSRVPAPGAAASVRLQRVQPQHPGRSGYRLQRGGDQGDAGGPQDLWRAEPAGERDLRARTGAACALRRA